MKTKLVELLKQLDSTHNSVWKHEISNASVHPYIRLAINEGHRKLESLSLEIEKIAPHVDPAVWDEAIKEVGLDGDFYKQEYFTPKVSR